MNQLTDEKRKEIWENIIQAIRDSHTPREGEMSIEEIAEVTGLSRPQTGHKLDKLVEGGVLSKRRVFPKAGGFINVYFPLEDTPIEDILKALGV
jgi:DNA-binding transcriptional ArsR family regulator